MSSLSLDQRLESVEHSLRRWKVLSVAGWSALVVCLFAAADDPANEQLNAKHVVADAVSSSCYNLVKDGKHYGGMTFGITPDGEAYPAFELKNGDAAIYAEVIKDSTILAITKKDMSPAALHVLKDQTYFTLSAPKGPIGMKAIASDANGGFIVLVDSKGKTEYITPRQSK